MTTSYFILVLLLCLSTAYINYSEAKKSKLTESKSDYYYLLATQLVLFIGVASRLVYLEYPFGINLDEAIAGYDAWCLANYGVDQHLYSYPVYLKSWGSGQSALYAYLSAPLIKLFGLSLPMHRLPMAIVSSVALFCFYFALKKANIKGLFVFLCILFLAFNPWHFTASRWALDCNLAPSLLLIATCVIIIAYYTAHRKKQLLLYALGFISIGITAYGYAVAWLMIPFYTIAILVFLYKKKSLSIKQCGILLILAIFTAAPLILFALQMFSGGDEISLSILSIPKMNVGRHETTNIFGLNASELLIYLQETLKSLITGYDYLLSNSFPYTGQFYNPIGWFFVLIAFICLWKRKELNIFDSLFLMWLLACIPIIFFVFYNVNRWNMIWFPLIYFCIRGIYFCISRQKVFQVAFYICFIVLTAITVTNYKIIHHKGFITDIDKMVDITARESIQTVYFTDRIQYPVILFYDPISPQELNRTKKEINPGNDFIFLSQFGKYNLGSFSPEPKPQTAYVILSEHINSLGINHDQFNIRKGEWLTVLWND